MKVAFLITAYNQPNHLRRLVKALEHPDFYFFVHIDLNADISPFKRLDFGKNTVFLEGDDRILVYHGGFTQVESSINLLRVAARTSDFDYFFFMSGSDYPIKPTLHIYDFLKTHYPTNFIDFYPLVSVAHGSEYIRKYYFDDLIGRLPKHIVKHARIGSNMLLGQLPDRAFPKGIIPFRGAAWFCINKATTQYILDYLNTKEARRLVNFFKRSWGAAEIFFHTIILNSAHARECRHYDPDIYGNHTVHLSEA